jgi:hypothetical protein
MTSEPRQGLSDDGRHLGCSGTRSPSRGNAQGGPTLGFARAEPRRHDARERIVADEIATAVPSGRLMQRVPRKGGSTKQATPACARHEQRHEVSEPIGLGRSSPRERSRWEVPSRGKLTSARPLARDVSAGRVVDVYVEPRSHPQLALTERSDATVAALAGYRERGRAGFWRSVVVLAGRIDCRSRQKARGPSRVWGRRVPEPREWV